MKAAILAAMLFAVPALAQDHRHPPRDAAIHEKFYQNWQMPDKPHMSCCNKQDCYPTEARFRDGHWYAQQRETGRWMRVPAAKVEINRDNPDGRNHVCASLTGDVFCFIPGGGT